MAAVGALFLAVLTAGCLPTTLLEPSTSGHSYGKGPLDAIREAADRTTSSGPYSYSSCGLHSVELAAMMMVPTYFEAGGPVPSPMALSRWDNVQDRFESYRNKGKAFKHIALIDDVVTTGATIETCIQILRKQFPDVQISILTIAVAQ
jgi:hypothetical protein